MSTGEDPIACCRCLNTRRGVLRGTLLRAVERRVPLKERSFLEYTFNRYSQMPRAASCTLHCAHQMQNKMATFEEKLLQLDQLALPRCLDAAAPLVAKVEESSPVQLSHDNEGAQCLTQKGSDLSAGCLQPSHKPETIVVPNPLLLPPPEDMDQILAAFDAFACSASAQSRPQRSLVSQIFTHRERKS